MLGLVGAGGVVPDGRFQLLLGGLLENVGGCLLMFRGVGVHHGCLLAGLILIGLGPSLEREGRCVVLSMAGLLGVVCEGLEGWRVGGRNAFS